MNSVLIMNFNYEVLVFEGLLKPITSDKKKIKDYRKTFWVSVSILYKDHKSTNYYMVP